MLSSILTFTLILAAVLAARIPVYDVERRYHATATGMTVTYFGQSRSQSADSLAKFCVDSAVDIVVLAFVHIIKGKGGLPGLNLSSYCWTPIDGTDLISCPEIGAAITQCQAQGKLVFLSLQGATGTQTLANDAAAIEYADSLWKLFGEGTGLERVRPFGGARVDGFDIDNENGNSDGWPKFVSELRRKYTTASKKYYISAAPQCPRPDASIGDAVYLVDYLFIQFYNNFCGTTRLVESFTAWSFDVAANSTVGTRIFAGFLGAPGTGSGYVTHSDMIGNVSQIRGHSNFGGVMSWDAACSNDNVDRNGATFLQAMRHALA